jgi:hypothetical protein
MRFIVDNQLPTALARWLSARGVGDAVHVLDIAFASSREIALYSNFWFSFAIFFISASIFSKSSGVMRCSMRKS